MDGAETAVDDGPERKGLWWLADVRTGGLDDAVHDAEAALAGMHVPPLTSVRVGGENEEMRASFRSLGFAFGLALFLVFLIGILIGVYQAVRQYGIGDNVLSVGSLFLMSSFCPTCIPDTWGVYWQPSWLST